MNRKKILLVTVVIVAISLLAVGCNKSPERVAAVTASQAPLEIKVLDVGQGDAILVKTGGNITLIDTGDVSMRANLLETLKKAGVQTIDNLIITHPHADHIGGVQAILNTYAVKNIYDSGQVTTSKLYKEYLTLVKKKNIPFKIVSEGEVIHLGEGAQLTVLNPFKPSLTGTNSDLNNNSMVMRLTFGNFSMLFGADAEKEAEKKILTKYANNLRSTVLKSPHHGSNTSSTSSYLKAISPEAVIISVGANNDYHHPHPSITKRYQNNKYKLYRTDKDGIVTIISDGSNYHIMKEKG